MQTAQIADFEKVLTTYLQPVMNQFLDLKIWALISAGGVWGADDDLLGKLNRELDGVRANHATSEEMSCPEDPWVPTCSISMILTIKSVEIEFDVILIRSEIVALEFSEKEFLEDLPDVDLAREFEKIQTHAILSRGRANT